MMEMMDNKIKKYKEMMKKCYNNNMNNYWRKDTLLKRLQSISVNVSF